MKFPFSTHFTPPTADEKEESVKQIICNRIDTEPELREILNGKTWNQIYQILKYY